MAEPKPTPLDPTHASALAARKPAEIARWFALEHQDVCGMIRVRTVLPKKSYDTARTLTFFFSTGQVALYRFVRETRSSNGACPHCGALFLRPTLRQVIGKHPNAHRTIREATGPGGTSTVIAEYGTTWACDDCIKTRGWTVIADPYGLEKAPWRGWIEKDTWANVEPLPQLYDARSLYECSVLIDIPNRTMAIEGREVNRD